MPSLHTSFHPSSQAGCLLNQQVVFSLASCRSQKLQLRLLPVHAGEVWCSDRPDSNENICMHMYCGMKNGMLSAQRQMKQQLASQCVADMTALGGWNVFLHTSRIAHMDT